ncbi:MAG: ferritin-like domain-containing protein [Clostridiales bacterium]|jgi:rubrerythrin|nr:ferritin-like domain-containing protein [Clostridiales bacterium]MDR2712671.1 ferritin-like domain-containing protein [Clostridiales bacterium]
MAWEQRRQEILEILGESLTAEKKAVKIYELMAERAGAIDDKEDILAIRTGEQKHYLILTQLYREQCGDNFHYDPSSLALPQRFGDMLQLAVYEKLAAVRRYQRLQNLYSCNRSKAQVAAIASEEKEHARILGGIHMAYRR